MVRGMKHTPILLLALVILSCGGKSKSESIDWDDEKSTIMSVEGNAHRDSVGENKDKATSKIPSEPASTSKQNSYSSHNDAGQEYDNMRGFDPASEDDMDDNGMSRYMENTDEEGWD